MMNLCMFEPYIRSQVVLVCYCFLRKVLDLFYVKIHVNVYVAYRLIYATLNCGLMAISRRVGHGWVQSMGWVGSEFF